MRCWRARTTRRGGTVADAALPIRWRIVHRARSSSATAVIGPVGTREEIPPLVYRAIPHVLEAMRSGLDVKISPLRPKLPIDEAATATGMQRDDLRKNVARNAVPFRSSEYVDWVRLADLIEWDARRYAEQQAALDELMGGTPDGIR